MWSLMTANSGGRKAPSTLPLETFSTAGTSKDLLSGDSPVEQVDVNE